MVSSADEDAQDVPKADRAKAQKQQPHACAQCHNAHQKCTRIPDQRRCKRCDDMRLECEDVQKIPRTASRTRRRAEDDEVAAQLLQPRRLRPRRPRRYDADGGGGGGGDDESGREGSVSSSNMSSGTDMELPDIGECVWGVGLDAGVRIGGQGGQGGELGSVDPFWDMPLQPQRQRDASLEASPSVPLSIEQPTVELSQMMNQLLPLAPRAISADEVGGYHDWSERGEVSDELMMQLLQHQQQQQQQQRRGSTVELVHGRGSIEAEEDVLLPLGDPEDTIPFYPAPSELRAHLDELHKSE